MCSGRTSTWRIFGLRSQADAETTRPLAYNQGFYNLFLALGVVAGIALLGVNLSAGVGLLLASTLSMVFAALVLSFAALRGGTRGRHGREPPKNVPSDAPHGT